MSNKHKYSKIEPFFDLIINALKKVLIAIIKGVMSPVIAAMRKVIDIVIGFIKNTIITPIANVLGKIIRTIFRPLKPFFVFISWILEFIVSIIRLILNIIDMIITLPFRIFGSLGLITFPEPVREERYKSVKDLSGIMKTSYMLEDVNKSIVNAAGDMHNVLSRRNVIVMLTIVVLSIIFITFYIFYDEFNTVVDEVIKFIKMVLYPNKNDE